MPGMRRDARYASQDARYASQDARYAYTLSGRIGKVVASHADLYYTRVAQGLLPMRVGGRTVN